MPIAKREFRVVIFLAAALFLLWGYEHFGRVSAQQMSLNNGPVEPISGLSVPGFSVFSNAAGLPLVSGKCVVDNTTSTASTGLWSMTISGAGFTTIKSVQVQAASTAATAAGTVNAGVSTVSTSTIGGITTVPSASVLGLIPLAANPTSAVVYITVCGV